jgi:hypothetical protein
VLTKCPIKLTEVCFDPVQPRLNVIQARLDPIHSAAKAALQTIQGSLIEEYPQQNHQCQQPKREIELHMIHIHSAPRNRSIVQN